MPHRFLGSAYPLTRRAFDAAAEILGVCSARLWAVVEVEAKRCGFLPDRRPVVLFERHAFHRRTGGRYGPSHPDISSPTPGGYGKGGGHQHDRLARAAALDLDAAVWSASWGLGQVMGFNAEAAGFPDMHAMVDAMCASEDAQLRGMATFIERRGLAKALRAGDWAAFARGYNGANYAINRYDERLEAAYRTFATGPVPDLRVREAQLLLAYLGHDPGPVDGRMGARTRRALDAFRAGARRLGGSGSLGEGDLEALRHEAYPPRAVIAGAPSVPSGSAA